MSARSHWLLLFCLFSLLPSFSNAQFTKEQLQKIDQVFAKWNRTDRPGAALAVIHNGTIVYEKGYGMADLEHGIAIRPETVFYIGSVSKQFVAMCMLLLEEAGKIDLDADIRTYLPEFPDYGTPVTSRNLIHHTSGIRDNLTLWELKGRSHLDEIPESEIYDLIKRQEKLNFEPGTEYRYSNSCYFMMSMIIERVSGQTLREYADENIFKKLGMSHTFFGDDNRRIIRNRAFGYNENRAGEIENMIMRFDLVGSGGLYSNVQDMFLWDQNFYHNKLGKNGQELIDKMLTNGRYKDGSEVNYAFAVVNDNYRGLRTISHSGALGGYRAFYVQFPDQQFSVVILGNVTTLGPTGLGYAVADVCLADLLEPEVPKKAAGTATAAIKPEKETAPTLSTAELNVYAGRFYSPELDFSYDLEVKDSQLILKIGETEEIPLQPVSDTSFETDHGLGLEFKPTKKGKMDQFLLDAGRVSGIHFDRQK